jgi:hypothetical protein
VCPRKRHQMRHLCDFACFLAKQVLSQLSYTPPCNYMIPIVSLIEFRENDYLLCWQVLTQIDGSTHQVQPSPYEVLTMTS